jgi:hypothetical protein
MVVVFIHESFPFIKIVLVVDRSQRIQFVLFFRSAHLDAFQVPFAFIKVANSFNRVLKVHFGIIPMCGFGFGSLAVPVVHIIVEEEKLGVILVVSGDEDLLFAGTHCQQFLLTVGDFVFIEHPTTLNKVPLHSLNHSSEEFIAHFADHVHIVLVAILINLINAIEDVFADLLVLAQTEVHLEYFKFHLVGEARNFVLLDLVHKQLLVSVEAIFAAQFTLGWILEILEVLDFAQVHTLVVFILVALSQVPHVSRSHSLHLSLVLSASAGVVQTDQLAFCHLFFEVLHVEHQSPQLCRSRPFFFRKVKLYVQQRRAHHQHNLVVQVHHAPVHFLSHELF